MTNVALYHDNILTNKIRFVKKYFLSVMKATIAHRELRCQIAS